MLHFFRRYQRFFFLIVTVIIVISFSFFGTFGAIERMEPIHETAMVATDGSQIRRSEIEDMIAFINTDEEQFFAAGGQAGGNYLNDGVISRDFLSTGMADILVDKFQSELIAEWKEKLAQEKKSGFYVHPEASFISAEAMWGYFAPNIKKGVSQIRKTEFENAKQWFDLHKNLYLAEQEFPSLALKQVLRYQERQYRWVQADPDVERLDLALFGYHSTEDWFGTKFVHLVSQFIINASKIAEQKGYRVTPEEALADLSLRADHVYQRFSKYVDMGSKGSSQVFADGLRQLGMDRARAVEVWQRVLLFRRLFDSVGTAMFLDPQMFQQFDRYALETVSGELYQLPPEFRFVHFLDLQRFEAYLTAISTRNEKEPLALPTQALTLAEVRSAHPQLVQKRYLLDVAEVSRKNLNALVGIKAMWDWQVADKNWATLVSHFNELGTKPAKTSDERFQVLEKLSTATRARIDEFSREAIVAEHPDWLADAFKSAETQRITVGIPFKGGKLPFVGIEDRQGLISLLDSAPIGQLSPKLERYSGNGQTFYRIQVVDRSQDWEIMTYAEAVQNGAIDELLLTSLQPAYETLKLSNGQAYKKVDGSYKPLAEVRDQVAAEYYQPLLQAITKSSSQKIPDNSLAASYRFFSYMQQLRNELAKDPAIHEKYVRHSLPPKGDQLSPPTPVTDQWKLILGSSAVGRSDESTVEEQQTLFALKAGQLSPVFFRPGGDLRFLLVKELQHPDSKVISAQQMRVTQTILANEVKGQLMVRTLNEITEKNAMSLDYLKRSARYSEQDSRAEDEATKEG